MNDVVEKAKKRIAEIEAEAQRLRTFLAVYKALESSDSVLIGDSASAEVVRDGHFTPSRTTSKPSEIIKAAKSAIRDRGRPLTRTQLVQMLEAQGLVIGGADACSMSQ